MRGGGVWMEVEAGDRWGNTREVVRVIIRDIHVHFVKGEECTVLKVFREGDVVPFAELEIPRGRMEGSGDTG